MKWTQFRRQCFFLHVFLMLYEIHYWNRLISTNCGFAFTQTTSVSDTEQPAADTLHIRFDKSFLVTFQIVADVFRFFSVRFVSGKCTVSALCSFSSFEMCARSCECLRMYRVRACVRMPKRCFCDTVYLNGSHAPIRSHSYIHIDAKSQRHERIRSIVHSQFWFLLGSHSQSKIVCAPIQWRKK